MEGKEVIEPNEPLDLNQVVMKMSTQVGVKNLKEDNRKAALLNRILYSWVKDKELRKKSKRLPLRMSRNEAKDRLRRENSSAFPLVQEIVESKDGTLERYIDEDFYYKLMDAIGDEMYDLKKQGILNWGVGEKKDVEGVFIDNARKR